MAYENLQHKEGFFCVEEVLCPVLDFLGKAIIWRQRSSSRYFIEANTDILDNPTDASFKFSIRWSLSKTFSWKVITLPYACANYQRPEQQQQSH